MPHESSKKQDKTMRDHYRIHAAVVILHYGDVQLTKRLHKQLLSSDPGFEEHILVLDNNSPQKYPDAWICLPQNIYWAGALDWTVRKLSALNYTHLWFLNNDIMFESAPPILEKTLTRLSWIQGRVGRVGVYSPSVTVNPYHPQMVADTRFQFRKVRYIDGIAPFINLECWQELENLGVSENPIGYGVDVFLSMQADSRDWGVVVDHQVVIKHRYHSTSRTIKGFLKAASIMSNSYLEKRLGPGSMSRLDDLACDYMDHH